MENETNQPALCRNGCGFYGNPSTEGMCSKCFKDTLRRKQSSPTSTTSSSSSTMPASAQGSSSNTSVEGAVAMAASISSSMLSSLPSSSSDNTKDDRQPNVDSEADPPEEPKDKSKTKRNRCFTCRKKVGLTGFECRCANVFCGLHRYSDKHDCTFDYKAEGRAKITKDNPVILAEKIQKI